MLSIGLAVRGLLHKVALEVNLQECAQINEDANICITHREIPFGNSERQKDVEDFVEANIGHIMNLTNPLRSARNSYELPLPPNVDCARYTLNNVSMLGFVKGDNLCVEIAFSE